MRHVVLQPVEFTTTSAPVPVLELIPIRADGVTPTIKEIRAQVV